MRICSPTAVRLNCPGVKPFMAMRPPNRTCPLATRAADVLDPDPRPVERDDAVDGFEPVRQRQVADASVGEPRAAGEARLRQRPGDVRQQRRRAAAAQIAEEPLEDAQVRLAGGLDGDRLIRQVDLAPELKLRAFASDTQPAHVDHPLSQRELDVAVVAQLVVEQLQVEPFDRGLDQQAIEVGELAGHTYGSTGDRGRERGQARFEEPDIGIQRRVLEPEIQFRITLRGQRKAA